MCPLARRCGNVRGHTGIAQAGQLSWHNVRTALHVIIYDGERSTKKGWYVLDWQRLIASGKSTNFVQ